jgi:ferredoxin
MKVKFIPQNIELEISPGQSVLDLAQQNDIHIQSVCKGIPSCAECRVYVKEGDHNVMPPQPKELELIGTAYFVDQRRLSCQLRCFGDVVVDLTEQNEKQNKSTKNPQGRYVKEREDSHARMGNLLEELTEEEMQYEKELEEERKNNPIQGRTSGGQKAKLDNRSFYNVDVADDKNKSQNSNRRPQKNNPQKSNSPNPQNTQNAKAGDGEASKSAKRNRNRRRNKNRNKKPEPSNGSGAE